MNAVPKQGTYTERSAQAHLETFSMTETSQLWTALERDGGAIVQVLLTPEQVARLNRELDNIIECTEPGTAGCNTAESQFYGARTKRFTNLIEHSPTFVELLEHPLLHAWAARSLLKHAGSYWLNTAQAMIVGPGSPAQKLHRDQDNWPVFSMLGRQAPQATIGCMIALTDFTEERGATRVLPGSHNWTDYSVPGLPEQTVPAVMPAGSGLLYYGNTIHGAGHNRTNDHWRRAIHISFVLGYLTPEEASPLEVSLERAKTLSPLARRMLGFESQYSFPSGGQIWSVEMKCAAEALGLA